ncbi:Oxidoreductase, short-chain dehydrogenase/reductase family [Pseudoalteromonas luteoviolacea B = ATCC 29581]|nr:Oxidoreductase, short-chain dehydrogenase/reductase family [Pseudoalteromonas luteoviolacea B = ATCC 29581]
MNKKLAVLTGATGGIGSAIAQQLAKAGWTLLLVGRNESMLSALRDELGPKHQFLVEDLRDEKAILAIASCAQQMGGADLLVNNAGVNQMLPFEHTPTDTIESQISINLIAPMRLTHSLLSQLKQQRGTVVNVGSAFGAIGYPMQSIYCASKFGLRGFSEALSRELDGEVQVKYFAPRATDTSINGDRIRQLNSALGNAMDKPQYVADEFMKLLGSTSRRRAVGFPEKLFARLNGVFPELVDSALIKQLKVIKAYFVTKETSL